MLSSPSADLKYFSMIEKSLGLGMLFMTIEIPLEQGQINSDHIADLMFFSIELIWKIWVLASPIMFSARFGGTEMIACFLDSPFVVNCTFLALFVGLSNAMLCISRIFLSGRAGKASLILRTFEVYSATWVYNKGYFFFSFVI